MKTFNDKLTALIINEMGGRPLTGGTPEKTAEVIEALASHIGKIIALKCEGDARFMSEFLEGASMHMFETAAEMQHIGHFVADMRNAQKAGK